MPILNFPNAGKRSREVMLARVEMANELREMCNTLTKTDPGKARDPQSGEPLVPYWVFANMITRLVQGDEIELKTVPVNAERFDPDAYEPI